MPRSHASERRSSFGSCLILRARARATRTLFLSGTSATSPGASGAPPESRPASCLSRTAGPPPSVRAPRDPRPRPAVHGSTAPRRSSPRVHRPLRDDGRHGACGECADARSARASTHREPARTVSGQSSRATPAYSGPMGNGVQATLRSAAATTAAAASPPRTVAAAAPAPADTPWGVGSDPKRAGQRSSPDRRLRLRYGALHD